MFIDETNKIIRDGDAVYFTDEHYPENKKFGYSVSGTAEINHNILRIRCDGEYAKNPIGQTLYFELDNEPCYGVFVA